MTASPQYETKSHRQNESQRNFKMSVKVIDIFEISDTDDLLEVLTTLKDDKTRYILTSESDGNASNVVLLEETLTDGSTVQDIMIK